MSSTLYRKSFGDCVAEVIFGAILTGLVLLFLWIGAHVLNGATLKPKHISRVYSTHEVSVANGYKLEVGGDRYYLNAHNYALFVNCSVRPEQRFQVSTWEGCLGWESWKVEEIAKYEVRKQAMKP